MSKAQKPPGTTSKPPAKKKPVGTTGKSPAKKKAGVSKTAKKY